MGVQVRWVRGKGEKLAARWAASLKGAAWKRLPSTPAEYTKTVRPRTRQRSSRLSGRPWRVLLQLSSIQLAKARSATHDICSVLRSHQDRDRTWPMVYPEFAPAFAHNFPIILHHD